jgi:hypothetical protein
LKKYINFQILNQEIKFEPKRIWKIILEWGFSVQRKNAEQQSCEAKREENQELEKMRCLWNKIRTHFQENPE